jgi:zinc transport system substrate-binding protein
LTAASKVNVSFPAGRRRWLWNRLVASAALATLLLMAGCGPSNTPERTEKENRLQIATGAYLSQWLVSELVGPGIEVRSALPKGIEPHDAEFGAGELATLRSSTLVVGTSQALEVGLAKAAASAGIAEGAIFWLDSGLPAETRKRTERDPHFWTDPNLVVESARALAKWLQEKLDDRQAEIGERLKSVESRLKALDFAFSKGFERCESRTFVVFHSAFGYLAHRYGLTEVAVTGSDPEAEPKPSDVQRAIDTAKAERMPLVFADLEAGIAEMKEIAKAAGASVETLDPLEAEVADETYESRMYQNLSKLMAAMRCGPSPEKL